MNKSRYFKISPCLNTDYNSPECSFMYWEAEGFIQGAFAYSFVCDSHDLQKGKILKVVDGKVESSYVYGREKYYNNIIEEYRTKERYLEEIDKYKMIRELVV